MSRGIRFRSGMVASRPAPEPEPTFLILPPEPQPAEPKRAPMLTSAHIKAAIAGFALILLIGTGWTARGWYEGDKERARLEAEEAHRQFMTELANQVSTNTENAIRGIQVENKTIYTTAAKEIVRDVVYKDCVLPDAGRLRANQARRGAAAGKPDDSLSASKLAP